MAHQSSVAPVQTGGEYGSRKPRSIAPSRAASTSDLPDDVQALERHAMQTMQGVALAGFKIATAESCTGGLLASLITDLEGLSSSFECGFVSYSEESKRSLLNVPGRLITMHGAVSREVALAMANGALAQSHADLAVAITGFAGPAGKRDEEGLVHIAVIAKGAPLITRECHFGAAGRDVVRRRAVRAALEMLDEAIASEAGNR